MNTITIELCKEDRQRLDEVIAFLGLIVGELKSPRLTATAPQTPPEPAPPEITHPADVVSPHGQPAPAVEPAAEPAEPDTPKWTKDDLTKKVQALAAPGTGKREKVREIVKSYAPNVGAIPEDKYPEVMDKLIALEKEG